MLQNRVDPWGMLRTVPDRGSLMGNRGILHNEERSIVKPWAHKHWVTCLLAFNNIKRPSPFSTTNHYSELFFVDEANAFSAGHRPCAFCQRMRSNEFKAAWLRANVDAPDRASYSLSKIDAVLHNERAQRGGGKLVFEESLSQLPVGTMFEWNGDAHLVTTNGNLPWSFAGYGAPVELDRESRVKVLTPASIVKAFQVGFVPHSLSDETHATGLRRGVTL
jgi:hypothetical protein